MVIPKRQVLDHHFQSTSYLRTISSLQYTTKAYTSDTYHLSDRRNFTLHLRNIPYCLNIVSDIMCKEVISFHPIRAGKGLSKLLRHSQRNIQKFRTLEDTLGQIIQGGYQCYYYEGSLGVLTDHHYLLYIATIRHQEIPCTLILHCNCIDTIRG